MSPTPIHVSTADRQWLAGLVAVFAVSRALYAIAGVRFIHEGLTLSPQVLDTELLRHDFWSSLFVLHAQPPLMNAFWGVVVRTGHESTVFTLVYLAMGVALAMSMYLLMRALRTPAGFAFVVTAIFMVSPATVLYENWWLYTYPVALLLCLSGLSFAAFLRSRRTVYAVAFGSALALLALSRASVHVVFVVAAVAVLCLAAGRADWRRVLVACLVPVVVVLGLYAKNWVIVGEPVASSWLGLNLAHMVFVQTSPAELEREVKDGVISRQALTPPFSGLGAYPQVPKRERAGWAALDRERKANGLPNFNHLRFVDVSDQYRTDVLSYIRAHPVRYLELVGDGLRVASVPASDYAFVSENMTPAVADVDRLYRILLLQPRSAHLGDLPMAGFPAGHPPGADQLAWGIVLQYLVAIIVAPVLAVVWFRRRSSGVDPRQATLVYLSLVVIGMLAVSTATELGENQRFRFETDPIVCVIATAVVAAGWSWWRQRSRSASGVLPPSAEDGSLVVGSLPSSSSSA